MRSNEFDPEDLIMELNQKFAHVSIENADDMDREIHYEEVDAPFIATWSFFSHFFFSHFFLSS
jgi:hypothetical protein